MCNFCVLYRLQRLLTKEHTSKFWPHRTRHGPPPPTHMPNPSPWAYLLLILGLPPVAHHAPLQTLIHNLDPDALLKIKLSKIAHLKLSTLRQKLSLDPGWTYVNQMYLRVWLPIQDLASASLLLLTQAALRLWSPQSAWHCVPRPLSNPNRQWPEHSSNLCPHKTVAILFFC